MSSSPAESYYFTDASSTHSFFSSSTANSFFSALCKKKTGKKLKRKDFSEKIKDLGSGATGNIQLVYRKDNPEKYYALKEFIIPKHKASQEDERKFFKHLQTEYAIGSLLHHRNVVEVENFIYNDYYKRNRKERHIYQVMEYCNGGDLFDAIQSGNMSQGSILCCFKQLMEGLAYLHSMGVAHRDLKPENIMFKDNKILKILDFGASVMFRTPYSNEIIRSSGIVGSEPYMAPEQFSLKPYDPRTVDIWSCGIIFLAMFYNELPWKSAILSNLKYKVWAEKGISEIITDLPKGPRELITRMLQPDPEKRITIEEIFKDPWFKHIYCCQDHENNESSGVLDNSRYNYSTMSYSPSTINSSFRRPSDEMKSNTSYTGRTLKNKGSSIRFSDGVLSSYNSMTMSDTSDSGSLLKNHFSNSSEKTKVGEDNQSTNNEMNITKKAIFSIDTESDEEKDSDSPVSSSDIITKDNSEIVKEKEQQEEIGTIEEEDEEELKTYWGLDLKCSHEMS
jgi:serine/threonine protein kinase